MGIFYEKIIFWEGTQHAEMNQISDKLLYLQHKKITH